MNQRHRNHIDLQATARQIMLENGFEPDFPPEVHEQVAEIQRTPPQVTPSADVRDLRSLLWSSIDNDTSRDLDQLEVAEKLNDGSIKVLVAIADVDVFVPKDSPIDRHAERETTTVYTGVRNFPMLPEQLSTAASSLLENGDNLSVVTEYVVADGEVTRHQIYRALVRNKAQLAYNAVGAWLEGRGAPPPKVAASRELQAQLKLQDEAAQALKSSRHRHGALDIETIETHPVVLNEQIVDLEKQEKNRATELIEDFMIAANGVMAVTLADAKISSIRRVVRTPERWDRIVALADQHGARLPAQPDSKALNDFLGQQKKADPDHFADLSLAVIKLMGPGEYVVERPGEPAPGHFGLAVQNYTHSTAPNRRFADVVTQRLIKNVMAGKFTPYSDDDLSSVARNCTEKEDAARKVERAMSKRIAAVTMSNRIGQTFDSIVTGATPHGTFVRVLKPHVEGMLMHARGEDVGDRLRVKLINTDPEHGYIDFVRA
ncbi:MAG TPA: RNB domain-containing ribonuclease [Candidatus Acidoferrales bacterium]|jgi:exoribonuclease-2|nr:RNB domain-containing ribonuclease [Candidatus Acidoferrales bacterium]